MKKSQELRTVQGTDLTIQYLLIRKNVKNLNMRIKPDNQISVSANSLIPVSHIDKFVLSHEKNIQKAFIHFKNLKDNEPKPLQYKTGEKIRFLGEELILHIETSKTEYVKKQGHFLVLNVKDTENVLRKEQILNHWLKEKQVEIFLQICKEIYPLLKPYGVKYPFIKIRNMKSRWGSCQPQRGVITLNSKMISAPREAIEYVILHELVHFVHPNHSKQFYDLVEYLMPDWKERKTMLSEPLPTSK